MRCAAAALCLTPPLQLGLVTKGGGLSFQMLAFAWQGTTGAHGRAGLALPAHTSKLPQSHQTATSQGVARLLATQLPTMLAEALLHGVCTLLTDVLCAELVCSAQHQQRLQHLHACPALHLQRQAQTIPSVNAQVAATSTPLPP